MRKITVKKGEEKFKIPEPGIFVNGYIIKATICQHTKKIVEYNKGEKLPQRLQGE